MGQTIRFEWELPAPLLHTFEMDERKLTEEFKRAVVLDWVRTARISWRKGAELLGMAYREFLDLMSDHKVPLADYEAEWLNKELGAFKHITQKPLP